MLKKPYPPRSDIAAALAAAGKTQSQVAAEIGRSQSHLSHVIAGKSPVSARLADALSGATGARIAPTPDDEGVTADAG